MVPYHSGLWKLDSYVAVSEGEHYPNGIAIGGKAETAERVQTHGEAVVMSTKEARDLAREYGWDVPTEEEVRQRAMEGRL
jgi:hypothetical protein